MAGLTDDDARFAYLAEGSAKQARKRAAADVLIRDDSGRILLVNPTYKEHWDLPGGMTESNEPPHKAAERELAEELGATITAGRILVLDCIGPHGPLGRPTRVHLRRRNADRRAVGARACNRP